MRGGSSTEAPTSARCQRSCAGSDRWSREGVGSSTCGEEGGGAVVSACMPPGKATGGAGGRRVEHLNGHREHGACVQGELRVHRARRVGTEGG